MDSRNIQEVAGGTGDFLDVGGEAGEGSVRVFGVAMGVNAKRRPSSSESGYLSPARSSRSPEKGGRGPHLSSWASPQADQQIVNILQRWRPPPVSRSPPWEPG